MLTPIRTIFIIVLLGMSECYSDIGKLSPMAQSIHRKSQFDSLDDRELSVNSIQHQADELSDQNLSADVDELFKYEGLISTDVKSTRRVSRKLVHAKRKRSLEPEVESEGSGSGREVFIFND
ncbi:uncharacterized protein LOC143920189 [Arctopsyche grandis]|uniref:uncharacterized protein LOC143920189 n=1 Tax=Arctopsyche grandis TaxID=121162 RepID=UPI00406D676E